MEIHQQLLVSLGNVVYSQVLLSMTHPTDMFPLSLGSFYFQSLPKSYVVESKLIELLNPKILLTLLKASSNKVTNSSPCCKTRSGLEKKQ